MRMRVTKELKVVANTTLITEAISKSSQRNLIAETRHCGLKPIRFLVNVWFAKIVISGLPYRNFRLR